jgi:hypothetical protein
LEAAGSGKSKLVYVFAGVFLSLQTECSRSLVIENLNAEYSIIPQPAPILYFYCARDATEPERADPDEILRCILKQLCSSGSDQPIQEPVVKEFKTRKEEAEDDGCEPTKLTLTETVGLIVTLLDSNPATIIIDALDECDPCRRHELLAALDRIIQESASLVKIFVSSRDDNDIVYRLRHSWNVYINAGDNSKDIERFVQAEVEQSIQNGRLLGGNVSQELKNQILMALGSGAQGMWVFLPKLLLSADMRLGLDGSVCKFRIFATLDDLKLRVTSLGSLESFQSL